MNDDAINDATEQTITLNNEAITDAAVFDTNDPSNPATTAATASTIAPDAHFLSSGLKLDTKLFLKGI